MSSFNLFCDTLSSCQTVRDSTASGGYVAGLVAPTACYSAILGGINNNIFDISGQCHNTISSGYGNTINANSFSTIANGCQNSILDGSIFGFIGSGSCNCIQALHSSIVGGQWNVNQGFHAFIGGGQCNTVCASCNGLVVGGQCNLVCAFNGSIVGGVGNVVTNIGGSGFIGGGDRNNVAGGDAGIVAGGNNVASGGASFIGAGGGNNACGNSSSVVGGSSNTVSGSYSSILGGSNNNDAGFTYAGIFGQNITAVSACTFHVNCLNACDTPSSPTGLPAGSIYYSTTLIPGAKTLYIV